MSIQKEFSATQRLVLLGILSALGTLLMFIELPWVFYNFLRIDLSDVVVLVAFVLFGFKEGILVGLIKALIHFMLPLLNPTGGVGEIAAFLASAGFITGFYVSHKHLKLNVIWSLGLTVVINAIIMTVLNWVIITPLFTMLYGGVFPNLFNMTYVWGIISIYIPFNALKGAVIVTVFYFITRTLKIEIKI